VARQRELSLRLSLGARPGRLIRQLLTETSILAAAGAAGGLILAPWLVHSLGALLPPTDLPVTLAGGIGWRTFAFTVLATVVVTLLCGVVPALVATRSSVSSALQSGQRAGGGRHSHTLRATLVVGEMALASLALVGAGLFLRSFHNASQTDPGFDSRQIDVSSFYLSSAGYSGAEQRKFCLDLRRRLETVPGVAAVGYADQIPLSFGPLPTHPLTVPDYATPPGEDMQISRIFVSPGFVSMLGIRLLDGRDFNEADKAGSPPVMLVSHAFARHFWGDGPAVGRTVLVEKEKYTVVGVTADANYNNLTGPAQPFFYIPFAQRFAPGLNFNVYIKWTGNRPGIAEALRREATALNQDAIYTTLTLAQATASSLYPLRVAATLLAVLGVVCLVLAGLGLYSVMSYSVAQRTRDLGVHIAMGARPVQLVAMVLRNGLTLACAGLLAGFVATWAASSFVGSMLVRVSAMDPSTLAGAGLFLGAVALLANFIPARRALSVQPLDALRSE
jgi:predicted permease